MIQFNNNPTLKVTEQELIKVLNSIGLNWYGSENLTTNDMQIIEDKLDVCLEIRQNKDIIFHDLNYNWED